MNDINTEKLAKLTPDRRRPHLTAIECKGNLKTETSTSLNIVFAILLFFISWMPGIVLAKGWMETLGTIFFFPYSYYLTVQKVMVLTGFI